MTPTQQIQEKIAQLQAALLASNPAMPTMLRTIHQAIKADQDLVTVLSDEEIGIITSGLMRVTNTVIAASVIKKSSKSIKKITLDDL